MVMAAFSKTGAENPMKKDETGGGEEPLVLLPPSAFQVPVARKPPNLQEDFSRAKAEIQKLKADIRALRELKASEVIPHHETSMVTPRSLPMEDSRYADVLIRRQSEEIWELKAQLSTAQAALLDHSADWEQQLSSKQREHRQVVASLEAALQDKQDSHDRQMDRLTEEHRREMEELTCRVTELTSELAEIKEQHQHEVEQLRLEMSSLSESGRSRIQALEQETRDKDVEVQQLECKVTQLKTYIGEAEQEHRPKEVWRTQNRTLENRVKLLTAEKENLESTMSLLNVRLESLTEMMAVQEMELSKTKGEKSEKKQRQLLLTRWREKVFALLVQQKSSEMMIKKENQNWNTKMQAMEEKLQSAHKCTELLSHSLAEKDAQLKIEKLNVSRLMEELNQAQSVAVHLDDQRAVDLEHTHSLQSAVSQLQHRMDSFASELQDALSQLDTYGQRIGFASGRLQMLQGQFARGKALLRLELMEAGRPQREDCCSAKHLAAAELERVQRERDALSAQIKADASTFQERLTTALSHSEEEVEELHSKVNELESVVLDKSKACEQLSSQVQELQTQLEEAEHRVESLSTDLARQQLLLSQAVEDQKVEDEARHRERLTELDQQLNDVRREQTKAVVSLHQAERREHREQERAADHLRTVEAHYQRQVDRLQSTLRAIEKERNLMMATLRQEGLMSKVHLERGEPIKLDLDCLEELPPLPAFAASAAPDKESVKSVIEDLKSLTAAVLQEDDNSSEPDE